MKPRGAGWPAVLASALLLSACDGGSAGGDDAAIDIQAAHANGVVLQIASARTSGDRTLVNVRVMNGRDRDIDLNSSDETSYLLTDSGEKLFLVPSPANDDLSIPAGQTIDVALVFAGKPRRNAPATLVLNERGSADSVSASNPRFQIALPMDRAVRGGSIPEASALSNMRANVASNLRPAAPGGSGLTAGGQATSTLQAVEAMRTELGAVDTERGTVVSLPGDVTFDFDKATVRDGARGTLDRLAQLIQAGGAGQIAIEGHTDSMGDDAYNRRLSQQRAEAVKSYLVARGVAGARVQTTGLGETRPVAPNASPDGSDDEAGRQRNRRVEVILPNSAPAAAEGERPSTLTPAS